MAVVRELRHRARHIAPQVAAACLVAYFAYHAVQGDGGLFAYLRVETALGKAKAVEAELEAQRKDLARRVKLLHPSTLDPDLLSERARAVLNFAREDDVIVIVQDDAAGSSTGKDRIPSPGRN